MKTAFWITWEDHRRSRELASALQAKYICLTHPGSRCIRYPLLSIKTVFFLFKNKVEIIYCQNPSIILNLLLCLLKPLLKYRLFVDRHSNFKFHTSTSKNPKWKLFHWISLYTLKRSDLTIVTNAYLKAYVDGNGGKGIVLPDKLPYFPNPKKQKLLGDLNYVFVSTFSEDEPILEVIEACKKISPEKHIYITGNFKKYSGLAHLLKTKPSNVTLTGFLPEEDYQSLLHSADALIVITNQEYTLTCGAYEAVSLGKPMVLGNTKTIMEYFSSGAVYCDATSVDLAAKIDLAGKNIENLRAQVAELKLRLTASWQEQFSVLKSSIEDLTKDSR